MNNRMLERLHQAHKTGMRVSVHLKNSRTKYYGIITEINDTDLVIENEDGQWAQVMLSHICATSTCAPCRPVRRPSRRAIA